MSTDALVTYLLTGVENSSEFWYALADLGLVYSCTKEDGEHASFGTQCGCEDCAEIPGSSVEELRAWLEPRLARLGITFSYLGGEMVDYDEDEY